MTDTPATEQISRLRESAAKVMPGVPREQLIAAAAAIERGQQLMCDFQDVLFWMEIAAAHRTYTDSELIVLRSKYQKMRERWGESRSFP